MHGKTIAMLRTGSRQNYAKYAAMVGNLDALYDWLSTLARNSYMSNNTDNNITLVMLTGQNR